MVNLLKRDHRFLLWLFLVSKDTEHFSVTILQLVNVGNKDDLTRCQNGTLVTLVLILIQCWMLVGQIWENLDFCF